MKKAIHLYTPYYLSDDHERQKELDLCLQKNVDVKEVDRIFLMIDDGHVPPVTSDKITILPIPGRPSYSDWLDLTAEHSSGALSVLANSDIYLDATVTELHKIFDSSDRALAAISRYEIQGDKITMHPKPQWSQDVWVVDGTVPVPDQIRKKMQIPLGVPRCDNKIGYVFSVHGYDIFNPCTFVRTYHLHETQLRGYDNHVDKRILGGTAWIFPSETLTTPSKMVFDIWSLKPEPVERIKVNDTIIVKEKQGLGQPKRKKSDMIVAYDHNWQFPAITEQHAFNMLSEQLDTRRTDGRVIYFAFPWATLIDNLLHNKKNPEKTAFLKQKLLSFKPRLEQAETIVTTCQHIHMLRFQDLFDEMGITDIFWSHAIKGQPALPDHKGIALHPFPLYPVQAKDVWREKPAPKKHLYSFVGAKANQYYLTQSRNIIIEDLSKTNTGFVVGNDTWHYNKVVYDYQVRGTADKPDALVDNNASENFKKILRESVFSLCPSGTGPNSIRLWESIGLGSIPVILADTLALPGNPALWEQAAVFCKEDKDSILKLPDVLKKIHKDPAQLKAKRHAMAQIWKLYGIENFVHDIRKLILEKSQDAAQRPLPEAASQTAAKTAPAQPAARPVLAGQGSLNSITTDILLSPEQAKALFKKEKPQIQKLLAAASPVQKDIFARALTARNLKADWDKA
ncbi:exostosin family protein [Maritimibacter alkaliphilus]|uniref:exostosin domain-containing protein n=1 Tax=Maritimibacter alkaliphilus TaxID=404236 RepID=UPI001C9844A8|nr:exostosin family protein [Maritimibacter alkaliphilus]MBY6092896.1 glycosyltransferase family 47 protein [Maritimibacter alkaliphilus]